MKRINMCLRKVVFVLLIGCMTPALWAQARLEPTGEAKLLPSALNSPLDETAPRLNPATATLYFTRLNHPENVGGRGDASDIWYAPLAQNVSHVLNADIPVNDAGFNYLMGFSGQGKRLYLLNRRAQGEVKPYVAALAENGQKWQVPEPVLIPYFFNKSTHQSGYIDEGEKIMLFAVESSGTYGNEDIYVSLRDREGNWAPLQNLGSVINTPYEERSPYLLSDGKTLLFASNGHKGKGSWDLYQSYRLDNTWMRWSVPENLGPAFNSIGSETAICVNADATEAFFSSTKNSDGHANLWRIPVQLAPLNPDQAKELLAEAAANTDTVASTAAPNTDTVASTAAPLDIKEEKQEIKEADIALRFRVLDSISEQPLPLSVSLRLGLRGANSFSLDTLHNLLEAGSLSLSLSPQDAASFSQEGSLSVRTEGYLPLSRTFSSSNALQAPITLKLRPIRKGDILLEDVRFVRGKAEFLLPPDEALGGIVQLLEDNPQMKFFIAGHTDNLGLLKDNVRLSEKRVQAVISYFVAKGISASRLSGKGYGGTRPVASNRNEKGRAKNRRVEFIVEMP